MEGNRRNVYLACNLFGNAAFMGVCILVALFPERGALYFALYCVIDQLMLWTVGLTLTASVEENHKRTLLQKIGHTVNLATVGLAIAILSIFTGIKLPPFIDTAPVKIGNMTSPLAMVYMGGLFCFLPFKKYIKDKAIYLAVLLRMVILPIGLYYLFTAIAIASHEINVTISILCAMPTMVVIAMLAQNQNSDNDFCAGMIGITTACSAVTIPLVCYVIG